MDKIKKLIAQLESEISALKENIESFKRMIEWSSNDTELEADLAFVETQYLYYKNYLTSLAKIKVDVVQKEVYAQPLNNLEPYKEYLGLREGILDFVTKMTSQIAQDLVVQDVIFTQSILLVEAIGVRTKHPKGIKGYLINKMLSKGQGYLETLVPYGKQVIEITKVFTKGKPPKAPKLGSHIKTAIYDRILNDIKEKYEYSDTVKGYLNNWAKVTYEDGSVNIQDKIISMRCMREWLVNENLSGSDADRFEKLVKKLKLEFITECFELATVPITQVCNTSEFGEIYREDVYRTKFSNHEDSNRQIIGGLVDVGVKVSAGVIETDVLESYFPNCPINFVARIEEPLDEQIMDNYAHQSPSATMAQARIRALERRAREREEKKKELERIRNKKYIYLD